MRAARQTPPALSLFIEVGEVEDSLPALVRAPAGPTFSGCGGIATNDGENEE